MKSQSANTLTPVLVSVFAIVAFTALAWYAWPTLKRTTNVETRTTTATTNRTQQKNTVTNSIAISDTSTAPGVTTGWKTYTSEQGWSIQYPSTYQQSITSGFTFPDSVVKISDTSNGDSSLDPNDVFYDITVEEYPNDESNQAMYAWQDAGFPEPFAAGYVDKLKVQLGNNEATRFKVNVTGQTVYVYYIRGTNTLWKINDRRIGSGGQINEDIIKTFTLADPTAGWKTYSNTTYGFSFQYPLSFKDFSASAVGTYWRGLGLVTTSNEHGSIDISVKEKKYDPVRIEGLYGPIELKNQTTVKFGTRSGTMFLSGDGGCGGQEALTSLGSAQTLWVTFGDCEDAESGSSISLYNQKELINSILTTFIFTK